MILLTVQQQGDGTREYQLWINREEAGNPNLKELQGQLGKKPSAATVGKLRWRMKQGQWSLEFTVTPKMRVPPEHVDVQIKNRLHTRLGVDIRLVEPAYSRLVA